MKKEKILGFNVCSIDEKEIINRIFLDYQNNEQVFIVNINPEDKEHLKNLSKPMHEFYLERINKKLILDIYKVIQK